MPRVDAALSDSEDSGPNSEQNNVEEVIPPRINGKGKGPAKAEDEEPNDEEMGEEDDDDEEEVAYVVEDIKDHIWDRNTLKFRVKWEGYGSEDDTWEPEENLETAVDTLEIYLRKIGGRPTKPVKGTGAKKRGRQSTNAAADSVPGRSNSKRARTGAGRRSAATTAREASAEDGSDKVEWPKQRSSAWQPPDPQPGTNGNWEDLLLKVETVMVEEDGTKWAYLLWAIEDDSGKKVTTRARLSSVAIAAPQAMLRFYESHLVFTTPKNNGKANERRNMKPMEDSKDDIED